MHWAGKCTTGFYTRGLDERKHQVSSLGSFEGHIPWKVNSSEDLKAIFQLLRSFYTSLLICYVFGLILKPCTNVSGAQSGAGRCPKFNFVDLDPTVDRRERDGPSGVCLSAIQDKLISSAPWWKLGNYEQPPGWDRTKQKVVYSDKLA